MTPDSVRHLFRLLPAIRAMWNEVDPVFNLNTFWNDLMRPTRWRMDEVTPFERNRILMPETRQGYLDQARRRLENDFPGFSGAQALESWAGVLVTTLDNMPVLSAVPSLPGLFLGTGFYYGLTMGPAAGEALADLVMGQTRSSTCSGSVFRSGSVRAGAFNYCARHPSRRAGGFERIQPFAHENLVADRASKSPPQIRGRRQRRGKICGHHSSQPVGRIRIRP